MHIKHSVIKRGGLGVFALALTFPAMATSNSEVVPQNNTNDKLTPHPQFEPYWYLGARGGFSAYSDACSSGALDCDDTSLGYGIYGGYQFNDWFGLEGGVTNYGSISASYTNGYTEADVSGADLTAKFSVGLIDNVDLYAKVGTAYQFIDRKLSWSDDTEPSGWVGTSSVGVDYALFDRWSVRAEYQFISETNDSYSASNIHFTSLGVTYRFGMADEKAVRPTPKPIVKHADIPPVPMEQTFVSTSISLRSEFDSADFISSEDELVRLVNQIKQGKGHVIITGNADAVGPVGYNQSLSEKRAQTVAKELISRGVASERITVRGNGELAPVADNDTLEGRALNRQTTIEYKMMTLQSIDEAM
ncbi:outer membrane beta-barrel protein [Vibrio paucivorans]|uniref:Outer membrane beta-barrel protein n=1 Tax=Vibrio paucivorans TaxID=2829489 RepID=A0A9X3HUA3_9VIBR|nr:outer membrane beta-barrel protein [Vibrio paucivorans]MCW8336403.1 outer membrane beta-barrel protein [Vibrio paucivorans]